MSLFSFTDKLELKSPVSEVFQYFSDTDRLGELFPSSLAVRVTRRNARHLTQGSSISLHSRLFGIPLRWKSYIQALSKNRHISHVGHPDIFGSWEYNCYFESLRGGHTRITKCVLYQLPLGILSPVTSRLFIHPLLSLIFAHQRRVLELAFQALPPEERLPGKEKQRRQM